MRNTIDAIDSLLEAHQVITEGWNLSPDQIAEQFANWLKMVHSVLDTPTTQPQFRMWQGGTSEISWSGDDARLPFAMLGAKAVLISVRGQIAFQDGFISADRLRELSQLQSNTFDTRKLQALCNEINQNYASGNFLSVAMLLRALVDHVPPIFGVDKFSQVHSNYGGGKSFKNSMESLGNLMRPIADSFLHAQIRRSESLPTQNQVNFGPAIDTLLAEVIRILRQ
jgi:hypothetical protein